MMTVEPGKVRDKNQLSYLEVNYCSPMPDEFDGKIIFVDMNNK